MRHILLAIALTFTSLHAYGAELKSKETSSAQVKFQVKLKETNPPKGYLFDVVRDRALRRPIVSLILDERFPHWVKGIPKNRNYTSGPALEVESPIAGAMVYNACEAHNCGESRVEFLVTPHKKRAFALLKQGKHLRFVGEPGEKAKAILQAAMAK